MSSITNMVSPTWSGVAAGIVVANLLTPLQSAVGGNAPLQGTRLAYKIVSSSYSEYSQFLLSATIPSIDDQSLRSFYSGLLASQQSLGGEFEAVLYGNLWNLYAR